MTGRISSGNEIRANQHCSPSSQTLCVQLTEPKAGMALGIPQPACRASGLGIPVVHGEHKQVAAVAPGVGRRTAELAIAQQGVVV